MRRRDFLTLGGSGAAAIFLNGCTGEDSSQGHPQSGRPATITKQLEATGPISTSPVCRVQALTGSQVHEILKEETITAFKMHFIPNPGTRVKGNNVRLPNTLIDNRFEVYFRTNSSVLDELDIVDLDALVTNILQHPSKLHLTLEGFADARGSRVLNTEQNAAKNYQYSLERANAIKTYILSKVPAGKVTFEVIAHGSQKATGNPLSKGLAETLEHRKDRKVTLSQNVNIISSGLRKLPADVFLLDATGSMMEPMNNGKSRWQAVVEHPFPATSEIYTFTTTNQGRPCPTTLREQRVDGYTPFFDSVLEVLKKMQNGKSITVLTDGQDNRSVTNMREIISLAQQKGVKINIIGIGTPRDFNNILRDLATATGGDYYLHQ